MQKGNNNRSHRKADRAAAHQLSGLKKLKRFNIVRGDRSASQIRVRSPARRLRCGVSHLEIHLLGDRLRWQFSTTNELAWFRRAPRFRPDERIFKAVERALAPPFCDRWAGVDAR